MKIYHTVFSIFLIELILCFSAVNTQSNTQLPNSSLLQLAQQLSDDSSNSDVQFDFNPQTSFSQKLKSSSQSSSNTGSNSKTYNNAGTNSDSGSNKNSNQPLNMNSNPVAHYNANYGSNTNTQRDIHKTKNNANYAGFSESSNQIQSPNSADSSVDSDDESYGDEYNGFTVGKALVASEPSTNNDEDSQTPNQQFSSTLKASNIFHNGNQQNNSLQYNRASHKKCKPHQNPGTGKSKYRNNDGSTNSGNTYKAFDDSEQTNSINVPSKVQGAGAQPSVPVNTMPQSPIATSGPQLPQLPNDISSNFANNPLSDSGSSKLHNPVPNSASPNSGFNGGNMPNQQGPSMSNVPSGSNSPMMPNMPSGQNSPMMPNMPSGQSSPMMPNAPMGSSFGMSNMMMPNSPMGGMAASMMNGMGGRMMGGMASSMLGGVSPGMMPYLSGGGAFGAGMGLGGAVMPLAAARPVIPIAQYQAQIPIQPVVIPTAQQVRVPLIQPIAQPIIQPVVQPIAQPITQPIVQPISQPVIQPIVQQPVSPAPSTRNIFNLVFSPVNVIIVHPELLTKTSLVVVTVAPTIVSTVESQSAATTATEASATDTCSVLLSPTSVMTSTISETYNAYAIPESSTTSSINFTLTSTEHCEETTSSSSEKYEQPTTTTTEHCEETTTSVKLYPIPTTASTTISTIAHEYQVFSDSIAPISTSTTTATTTDECKDEQKARTTTTTTSAVDYPQ